MKILLLVTVIAGVPILGTMLINATTSEADLSDLTPSHDAMGDSVLLSWPDLRWDSRPKLHLGGVQALGYMFVADRPAGKGDWVNEFVLLPEAGSLLHPAHRVRDQMITVHLAPGQRVQLSPRSLVWVFGNLALSPKRSAGLKGAYIVDGARVQPANESDIRRYFK